MSNEEATEQLRSYHRQIGELRARMHQLQAAMPPKPVDDYQLASANGTVSLSALFGDRPDLFVVHNMGAACPYCTLWADGFNGVYEHLANRASFVVSSPDLPSVQAKFAAKRGWRFPMVSHAGTSFAADMGFRGESGGWMPGVSVFRRDGASIVRVSGTSFGPGDDYCAVWHLFDLLPEGAAGWSPKFHYA